MESIVLKIGFVGIRGMVGSVLIERIQEEGDLAQHHPTFFSTSQAGQTITIQNKAHIYKDANDISQLEKMDIIVATQGSAYTKNIHPQLRSNNWQGYWLDAASHLRMCQDSLIILDPVNHTAIQEGLKTGIKDFIGSNCTVSLMLMSICGLVNHGLVKAIQATTYQAISGAGSKAITELYQQMAVTSQIAPHQTGLNLANTIHQTLQKPHALPQNVIQHPLSMNILPWIDQAVSQGQSKEEWKAMAETNKILRTQTDPIPIDSTCVRTPTLRCHSQALHLELNENLPLNKLEDMIASAHPWVSIVPNTKEDTLKELTPIRCANKLTIKVGRIRKALRSDKHLQLFTTGDQLLWGAAEPIRRVLPMIIQHITSTRAKSPVTESTSHCESKVN